MKHSILLVCTAALAAMTFASGPPTGLKVGKPTTQNGVSVFPILGQTEPGQPQFITASEAAESGLVTFRELVPFDRSKLIVTNSSELPLLLLAGQLLIGGQQDRIVAFDQVVAAGDTAQISVYCGEMNNDRAPQGFRAGEFIVPVEVRRAAGQGNSFLTKDEELAVQLSVWNAIALANIGVERPRDASLAPTVHGEGPKDLAGRLMEDLSHNEQWSQAIGIVVFREGRPLWAEVFADCNLFKKYLPLIIGSAAQNALVRVPQTDQLPSAKDASAFLESVLAQRTRVVSSGETTLDYRNIDVCELFFKASKSGSDGAIPHFVHGVYFAPVSSH